LAEVLVLGASACAGDLAAKARRCGLTMAEMTQLLRRLDLGCV
tara:strand:- start:666 stop:794 length:129 start_codon:yes stop_codon:yes gene_type:complete